MLFLALSVFLTRLARTWSFEINEHGLVLSSVRRRRIGWSAITRIGWANANGQTDPTTRPWLPPVFGPSLSTTYPALAFECGPQLYVVDQTIGLEARTRSQLVETLALYATKHGIPLEVDPDDLVEPADRTWGPGKAPSHKHSDLTDWTAERRRKRLPAG